MSASAEMITLATSERELVRPMSLFTSVL
jgi:hypothetical protein